MRYTRLVAFLTLFATVVALPVLAEDKPANRFQIGAFGGLAQGNTDYPGKQLTLGGGIYYHPFYRKNAAAQRLSFGAELSRMVLNSEKISQAERFQDKLWLISPGIRYDALDTTHFRVSLHAGGTLARNTQVYQVKYQRRWVDIRDFGYYCDVCQSSMQLVANGGISFALVKPVRDYNDDVLSRWIFPVRYTRYSNGLKTITFGIEYSFK
ncbi:MAG: hypothetical protein Q7S09_00560 [bacterium]|nr:hypothetical protein [bacterium]